MALGQGHGPQNNPPDNLRQIIATAHWAASGFPNADLDHKLKRNGKEKIILSGLQANTCCEATGRIGMQLGCDVTPMRDVLVLRGDERGARH